MKKTFLFLALLAGGYAQAQNIKLKKGQTLNISTNTTQNMDLGMAGQMTNTSTSSSLLEVKEADKNSYITSTKMTKLTMSIDGMGQNQSFDSDKPEDRNSEMGKSLGETIDKEVKVTVDNNTGKISVDKPADPEKKEEGENPLEGLMNMFGDANNDGALVDMVFFVLPQGKKAGDSWTDSSQVKNKSKVYKTYTVKELGADMAKIALQTKMSGSTSTEMQGTQIDVSLNTKSNGEIIVNPKTSIVQKITRVTDVEGSMDVMGQSMPITSKINEEIVIK